MTSKNITVLMKFIDYCFAHPELRFWQALRNWSEYDSILARTYYLATQEDKDTFYWEGKRHDD